MKMIGIGFLVTWGVIAAFAFFEKIFDLNFTCLFE